MFEIGDRMQATKDELIMIRDSVILPFLLDVTEKRMREIKTIQSPLKQLYINVTELLTKRIHTDIVALKKELKAREIKVWEEDRRTPSIHYKYVCRGYEEGFGLMKEVVKSELSVRLGRYVDELSKDLRK